MRAGGQGLLLPGTLAVWGAFRLPLRLNLGGIFGREVAGGGMLFGKAPLHQVRKDM